MYAKLVHRTVLITLLALAYPAASFAGFIGVGVTVGFAPPPLPVYVQPPCPAPGYIWTPGYWAYSYDAGDYYWVPGTWVLAPAFGFLWTPGYWGLFGAEYVWHEGYWGPHVGFYGGINYGFGYFGSGYVGGYWRDHDFYYNRAVTNVSNVNVTNVYNRTVVNNNFYGSRPSFNGTNGVQARPTRGDLLAMREPHRVLTPQQRAQAASARALPSSLASVNHGHPQIVATPWPGVFHGQGVAASRYANRTSAPSSYPSLIDASRGLNSNRNATLNSSSRNTRPQLSEAPQYRPRPHEQHGPTASAAPHGGFGPSTVRTPAAESRAPTAHWSPAPSYRPAQPYRASPSYSQPPSRQAFSQAPRSAPALHNTAQPPQVNHQAPAQNQRRS
jgi:WXXGXW repeat (2 copies)